MTVVVAEKSDVDVTLFVVDVNVLFVSVCVSDVPTTVPLGAPLSEPILIFDGATSMSISLFTVSSVTVIFDDPALIFLN